MPEPQRSQPQASVACLLPTQPLGLALRSALARCGVQATSFQSIVALAGGVRPGTPLIVMEYLPGTWHGWHSMLLQTHRAAAVPVLAIGQAQAAAMADALAHGACDYLVRTPDCTPIAERILARLHCPPPARAPAAHHRPPTLDPATRTLALGARRTELSGPEFRLAQLFLRHPGQLIDMATLSRLAWGGAPSVSRRGIARQVLGLKRKLEALQGAGPGQLLLQTVHGMGYRLQVTTSRAPH